MKGTSIGYACIVLVLLAWATLPSPVELYSQRIFGQPVITVTIPDYAHRMVLWAEWIRLPHRRRRHYPRRHRLPRKRRRRLQLRLRRILKRQRRTVLERRREDARSECLRTGKEILVVVGVTIAVIAVLYLAASGWLNTVWHFIFQNCVWGAPCCLMGVISRVSGSGQKAVTCTASWHFHPEFDHCLICGEKLKSRRYMNWRKPIQMLSENVYVTSRGRYCPHHPEVTYLSAEAAHLSLPKSTYGLDVLVHIGYQRDYQRMTSDRIRESLPAHIRVSERHLNNLYRKYEALLACAERLDIDKLKAAAAKFGGLVISVDGLEPEGGQSQLWVAREVLTGTILAAGWLPRVDEDTLREFLAPVKALDLPFLATVSDKQRALINALEATWLDLPHQYCQAHYLSNAVTPIYEADEHLKTQLRKQVRAEAGVTMRKVQAETKRRRETADDSSSLIVTGLAARPPEGLDEVKTIAQAVREAHRRGETISLQELDTHATSTSPANPPRTVAEVREALRDSDVLVYERRSEERPSSSLIETSTPNRLQAITELVEAYAARLRRVLSRSGRKPFRLAGLRLYADLLALLSSLEISLTHLPGEPRLTCFADAIRDGLRTFEADYTWIAEGYSWVLDISAILDVPLPEPGEKPPDTPFSSTVHARLDAYLEQLRQRTDLDAPLLAFRGHLQRLTERYAPGLFHCYDIPGLPRTDNDLESLFGRVRRQTLLTSGPHHARQRLHEEGAWLLFEVVSNERQQIERLRRVSLEDWRRERQRMQIHQVSFTDDRRFRRQSSKYLAELETQAADIALD